MDQLFVVLGKLAVEERSICDISRKLREIRELFSTATILSGGRIVDTCDLRKETSRSMAEMMIGGGLKDIDQSANRHFGEKGFGGP